MLEFYADQAGYGDGFEGTATTDCGLAVRRALAEYRMVSEAVVGFCREIMMAMDSVDAGGRIKINHWQEKAVEIRKMFE